MKNLDMPAEPLDSVNIVWNGEHKWKRVGDTGFTKREQACITLKIPESGDSELDGLIRKSRRQNMACEVAAALEVAAPHWENMDNITGEVDSEAVIRVDALIAQLEKES